MIEIKNLTFSYASQPLFQDFSWRVERSEFWSVIGPSGCGKSTLLHLLVGVRVPDAGTITVNEESVPRKKNRGKTGLVLQDYGLLPWATVRQNVELGLQIREFYGQGGDMSLRGAVLSERSESKDATKQSHPTAALPLPRGGLGRGRNDKVGAWLERFGIAHLRAKYPAQISGGQRQRAAIARTFVLEPDVLLMDEPFSALDAPTREDLEQLTLDLQTETKTTMVFVTHNIEQAVFLGRKILVLGAPPHRSPARVVENPGAGRAAYRDEPAFLARARELRAMLKHR